MAQIEAFRAIRFTSSEVSDLIAPPYDILSAEDKELLLRKDDHNIVAIDLPHVPPKSAGPDGAYQKAAGELTSWLDIRCLARDERPALYVYHQTYSLGGKTLTRKKFFARVRLAPLGGGSVFAHEETFGGPKEDRLHLTVATRCNLSPIFGLYPDAENEVSGVLDAAIGRPPDQTGVLDGIQNKLWVVSDADVIEAVREKMAEKPVFIADGHHRYETALLYRQREVEEMGEPLPGDPANFVLAVLGGMEDPGATIQPYFRTIAGGRHATAKDLQAALADAFVWARVARPATADGLARLLAGAGPSSFALFVARDEFCATLSPKDADLLAAYEPRRHPAWRKLPYAILHRYVLDEVFRKRFCNNEAPTVHYHKSLPEAIEDAKSCGGIAALMPATTMMQLRDCCTAGELMPQKSTYFYPKLATGLVINPLY